MSNYPDNFSPAAFNAYWGNGLTDAQQILEAHEEHIKAAVIKAFKEFPLATWSARTQRCSLITSALMSARKALNEYVSIRRKDWTKAEFAWVTIWMWNDADDQIGVQESIDDFMHFYSTAIDQI